MISSVREVEFDDEQREMFIALAKYRAETLCPSCGMDRAVCRAYENDGKITIESERCHVTTALSRKQSADTKNEQVEHAGGLVYTAVVNP